MPASAPVNSGFGKLCGATCFFALTGVLMDCHLLAVEFVGGVRLSAVP
jgi:hypothetical protein